MRDSGSVNTYGTHPQTEYELHPTNTKHVCSIQIIPSKNLVFELLTAGRGETCTGGSERSCTEHCLHQTIII